MLRTSLMVSCLVLLPLLAAAQDVDTASAVQTARSDAPPSLRALGITQLAVDVESASHVAISLFRATGEVSHTVEIDALVANARYRLTVGSTEGRVYTVLLAYTRQLNEVTMEASTSSGKNFSVTLETEPGAKGSRVRAVKTNTGKGWSQLGFADLSPTRHRDGVLESVLSQQEHAALFEEGAEAAILKAVLREFRSLTRPALDVRPAAHKLDRVESCQALKVGIQSGCNVRCWRMLSGLPLYVCDDGIYSGCHCQQSQGMWLLPDCDLQGMYFICDQDCGYFCALAGGQYCA